MTNIQEKTEIPAQQTGNIDSPTKWIENAQRENSNLASRIVHYSPSLFRSAGEYVVSIFSNQNNIDPKILWALVGAQNKTKEIMNQK